MCAKRLADDTILNEGFIEDYSTPKKRPRIEQSDTPSSSRKKSYSVDFKLKLVDEANKTSIAAISKKYSVDPAHQQWSRAVFDCNASVGERRKA